MQVEFNGRTGTFTVTMDADEASAFIEAVDGFGIPLDSIVAQVAQAIEAAPDEA